jgi:hypothetical protein
VVIAPLISRELARPCMLGSRTLQTRAGHSTDLPETVVAFVQVLLTVLGPLSHAGHGYDHDERQVDGAGPFGHIIR